MSKLVSIITPCLNSEKTIKRTVLSVLTQSYQNIQYLIIDGQSSDRTLEILHKYQKIDSRLFVMSQKDNSMTEALNRGLQLAKGDIIASLNADDWYEPDAIAHVVNLHNNKPFDCLIGDTRFVSETEQYLYLGRPWLAPWLPAWYIMGCLTPESSVFYSQACVETIGYFNESLKYTQDFEYYLRILKKSQVYYSRKVLSNFTVSANQHSALFHQQMESEVLSFINYKILRKMIAGNNLGSLFRLILGLRLYTVKQIIGHLSRLVKKKLFFLQFDKVPKL